MKPGCDGHVTQIALSAGWYKECECGRTWDYTDPRGGRITKEQYDERAARIAHLQNYGPSTDNQTREGANMAKSKKAVKKAAKKPVTKKTSVSEMAKSMPAEKFAMTSARRYCAFLVVTKPDVGNKDIGALVVKKFPDAPDSYTSGLAAAVIRSNLKTGKPGYEWLSGVKVNGKSKAKPATKAKAKAKGEAKPKAKRTAKPATKKKKVQRVY